LCPRCGSPETHVVDTRPSRDRIRRRRECDEGHRFTTFEVISGETAMKALGPRTRDALIRRVEQVIGR
jgi:transcriptional regulator NrdR family protein